MKKALIFLTSLLTLLVSFAHPSDAPLTALAEEATKETIYNSSFFDKNFSLVSDIRDFPEASFYRPLEADENETNKLNYALSSTKVTRIGGSGRDHPVYDKPNKSVEIPGVNVESSQDIIKTFISQLTEPTFYQNSTQDLTFLNVNGIEYKNAYEEVPENYNVALYYQQAQPAIYFNNLPNQQKEISFYLEPNFSGRALKDLITQYQLTGSLIFLQIDEVPVLKIEIQDNDFQFIASEGVSISFENHVVAASPASLRFPLFRVTIPYRTSISNIIGLRMAVVEESSNVTDYTFPETMVFTFHESMANSTFFYFFDIKSLSVANKTLEIEETSYTDFRLSSSETIDKSKMSASLVSMKLYFSGAIRLKENDQPVGDVFKSTQLSSTGKKITIVSLPETKNFDCTFTNQSESSGIWHYTTSEEIPTTSSGQMTIQSITFHPVVDETVRSDLTFTQDYSKTELFKYSFDLKKAARIYYFNWEGYYKVFSNNNIFKGLVDSNIFTDMSTSLLGSVLNYKFNYHCFGFSFYFDDDKKEAIPSVQKIRLKWQCGYKDANPDPDSGGFYPDTNDAAKKIHIEEKVVNQNRLANGTYALDKDGMFLSDKDSCHKALTQNGRFDYVVAKFRQRGDKTYNSYISQMAPLEIFYETVAGEVVRMVGISKGLHVVKDDDGNDIVVNSDGVAPDDEIYGIYVAEDGTKYPGIDKNGDGKITADEVINSDTGEGANLANPDDSTLLTDLENALSGLFNNLTELFKNPRSWLLTTFAIILIVSIVMVILNPTTLLSLFKSIKNSIGSLFSKAKKKPKKKTTKSKRKKR